MLIGKLEAHFDIPTLMKSEKVDSLSEISLFLLYRISDLAPILTNHHLSLGKIMLDGANLKNILIRDYKHTQLKLLGKKECEQIIIKGHCYSIIDSIERIHAILKVVDTCARFDTSYETMHCLEMMERLKATLRIGRMNQLKVDPEIGLTKVFTLDLFSDDEVPNNTPYTLPENRVCHKTLEGCIKFSINDLTEQYVKVRMTHWQTK
ncbi:hypothetical protein ISX50_08510 [Vibrio cyclitrophicus]|nr:hypothetical protein [Vibrio cyclitrophicus]UPR33174.1 hypothetical protein ISX50_08510 [Vibrio cyclitrophicus]